MIWKEIRKYIDERGFIQSVVARNAGMTKMALSDSLRGNRRLTAEEYLAICRALDVPASYFDERRSKEKEVHE